MFTPTDLAGYVASTLVLITFVAKDMRVLRSLAILSNIAFIIYGASASLMPVLCLHLALLPLNIARLRELNAARPALSQPTAQSLLVSAPVAAGGRQ